MSTPRPDDEPWARLDPALVERMRAAIDDGLREAQRRWQVQVEADAVLRWIVDRDEASPETAMHHIAEVALCVACAAGSDQAIAAFAREYFDEVRPALARRGPHIRVDDATQRLHERLFVSERPKIRHYSGHGKLRAWVRVVAMRLVTDLARESTSGVRTQTLDDDVPIGTPTDFELDYLKSRYAAEFRASFHVAVTRLQVRQRNLLRQHLLHGATYDDIAALYRVSRATCARWLAQARADLIAALREDFQRRLGLDADEIDDLMAIARSRIDLSLRAELRSGAAAAEPEPGG
jgi:RNA polymerase sigma-70 factor (ECF subfamily)